ncbi:MAG: hypothetical protein QXH37_07505 [Candidatus Bathyarchaeia archaeon]
MSDMVEIQVTKGLIRQVNEKCLQKTEYTIKAKLNSTEEIHITKIQIEAILNHWLKQTLQQLTTKILEDNR